MWDVSLKTIRYKRANKSGCNPKKETKETESKQNKKNRKKTRGKITYDCQEEENQNVLPYSICQSPYSKIYISIVYINQEA